jgi:hypothetical protein
MILQHSGDSFTFEMSRFIEMSKNYLSLLGKSIVVLIGVAVGSASGSGLDTLVTFDKPEGVLSSADYVEEYYSSLNRPGADLSFDVPEGESETYTNIRLRTEGGRGLPGGNESFSQKQDGKPGGSITINIDGVLDMVGGQGDGLRAITTGADSVDALSPLNYSAAPGAAGPIDFVQSGDVRQLGVRNRTNFAVYLESTSGSWQGWRNQDRARPKTEMRGVVSGDIVIRIETGARLESDSSGIYAKSNGGAASSIWMEDLDYQYKLDAYYFDEQNSSKKPAKHAGVVDAVLTGATLQVAGTGLFLQSAGGGVETPNDKSSNRPGGNGALVWARLFNSTVNTKMDLAHGIRAESLGGSVSQGKASGGVSLGMMARLEDRAGM